LLFACNQNKEIRSESNSVKEDSPRILKSKIFNDGDIEAYKDLRIAYLDYSPEEFLFWAMIMANKHDYPPAYFDVFLTLKNSYTPDASDYTLAAMDSATRQLAVSYLLKAAEKGDEQATDVLKDPINLRDK
jgi:hypothetical protein